MNKMQSHEIKSIALLALPLMAAFLAQKGMQFIDTVMMGWIGSEALAAASFGTAIFITILVFCMGTLSAAGVLIARAKGANNENDIKSSLQHGICLALLLSLPCMFLIWVSPNILFWLGEDAKIVSKTILLLHGLMWGFPGYLLFLVFREFISAFAYTRIVMIVAFSSMPLTFFANYILIYGSFGFPKLGIAGIGYAGAIIMWFMFACIFIYSYKKSQLNKYTSFKQFKFDREKIIDMLYIGVPSGILFVLESGMFLIASIFMGYFGVDTLAAHQIALQCTSVAYAIPFSLAMATALQVGHAIGANDISQAKRSAFYGLAIGLLLTAVIAIIFVFAPEKLVQIFLTGHESNYNKISDMATSLLMIAALFLCLDGVQAIANGALRGLRDTLIPMLLSIACYWFLGVGSAYYFAFHAESGAKGVWYGLTLGLCSIGIILIFRLLRKFTNVRRDFAYAQKIQI